MLIGGYGLCQHGAPYVCYEDGSVIYSCSRCHGIKQFGQIISNEVKKIRLNKRRILLARRK